MGTRRRNSQAHFATIPSANIPRSSFNRSHTYKTTFNAGNLIPFLVDDILPGDTFNVRSTLFARLATPIVPIMDNLYLDTFYFFVPYRLLWENWQRFNGEQDNPGDSTDYLTPVVQAPSGGFTVQSLADYFGFPTGVNNLEVSAFPFRAYQMIYNEWFRDQNMTASVYCPKDDGPDVMGTNKLGHGLHYRKKRHDYFTSCLPWPQKGPGVEIPIGTTASISGTTPVIGNGTALGLTDNIFPFTLSSHYGVITDASTGAQSATYNDIYANRSTFAGSTGQTVLDISAINNQLGSGNQNRAIGVTNTPSASGLIANFNSAASTAQVNLTTATAITINALRQAFQVQKLYERDARGGTRYTEILRSHFGVISPDARLQRPEYLGGSSSRVNVNPVAQTSSTDSNSPQGNLAAFGLVADHKGGFVKSFVEHGVLIGLLNVRSDYTYQQGINRMWSRQTRFDYYWPALAHLGEQAVLNKEIYAQGNPTDNDVFGYQERWAEYRYYPGQITGKFRSTYAQSLDYWHLAEHFTSLPTLSSQFLNENPPVDRVIAVPSEPHFILDCYVDMKCVRPMPVYSVPGLIDHF